MAATTKVVLDSWPVVEAAIGSQYAINAFNSLVAKQMPVMSAVNCAEVYNAIMVGQGVLKARDTITLLKQSVDLEFPDYERVMHAAHLKSTYYMALGDSFAVATALHHDAELWTGDTELLFDGSPWRARDLRTNRSPTRKQLTGKIGRRTRSHTRPSQEPEIPLADLMQFLNGTLHLRTE